MATGRVKPEAQLLRAVLGPDGRIVPDVAAKLPGRGAWVSAERSAVETAVAKRLFNRVFAQPVEAPAGLAGEYERLLEARALSLLGLARRAGALITGFDAVRSALNSEARPAWRIEASNAAPDGRGKLDRLAAAAHGEIPVAGCFTAEALGAALGREAVTHGALAQGGEARAFAAAMNKLAGFRPLDPFGDEGDRTGPGEEVHG